MRFLTLLLLFTFSSELTYKDSFGNEFVIENAERLPKNIDFEFLKSNLNTKHFIENFTQKSYDYKLNIMEIKKKNKSTYELKVQINPRIKDKNDIEETLKYRNPIHYILKTKRINKKMEIESVKLVSWEI